MDRFVLSRANYDILCEKQLDVWIVNILCFNSSKNNIYSNVDLIIQDLAEEYIRKVEAEARILYFWQYPMHPRHSHELDRSDWQWSRLGDKD